MKGAPQEVQILPIAKSLDAECVARVFIALAMFQNQSSVRKDLGE